MVEVKALEDSLSWIIKIQNEDYTLGELLRTQLLKDERVLFCSYNVNEMDKYLTFFIQTNGFSSGPELLSAAINHALNDVAALERQIKI